MSITLRRWLLPIEIMSNRDLSLKLTLHAIDKMSGPIARAMSTLTGETSKAVKAQRAEYQRLSQAREMLGIRSEHAIQREVQRTEAAYRRLAASGTLSWREQARAAEAMRRQVTALTNEMGKLTTAQKAAAGGRAVLGTVAGATAAGYVLKPAAEKAMDYDLRLAHMANTAFSDRDKAGRKLGARELDRAIVASIRKGGGTRDQASETLDALIASGAVPPSAAMAMLPDIMKAGTAHNADPKELANIAVRAMQNMKIKPEQMGTLFDMGGAAGQAGGFEIKDMSKWLPQQMAQASMLGITGEKGFAKLAALNQASITTAGTKDEAGNNLYNLLAKINSSDTAQDAKKLGINLPKYLVEQRAKGVDSFDAFAGLVDQTVSKQTAWKQLQTKLKSAKDDTEKREIYESQLAIVQGTGVGKLVQDQQALKALVGYLNTRGDYLATVQSKTLNSAGTTDRNFDPIADTASFSAQRAANSKDIATQSAMESLFPWIKAVTGGFADLAEKNPQLATAAVAATGALTALAAAAGAAGITSVLTGGGAGGTVGKISGAAGSLLRGAGGFALKWAIPLWGAWEAGQWAGGHINQGINWGISKLSGKDNSLGGLIYDLAHRNDQAHVNLNIKVDQDGRISAINGRSSNSILSLEGGIGWNMLMP